MEINAQEFKLPYHPLGQEENIFSQKGK